MSVHNLISSFKNAQNSNLNKFTVKKSILLLNIVSLMVINGYFLSYSENKNTLDVYLKYPIVNKLDISLVSKPSKKVYMDYKSIVKNFYKTDLLLISTKYGIVTNKELTLMKLGGEVLLKITN